MKYKKKPGDPYYQMSLIVLVILGLYHCLCNRQFSFSINELICLSRSNDMQVVKIGTYLRGNLEMI